MSRTQSFSLTVVAAALGLAACSGGSGSGVAQDSPDSRGSSPPPATTEAPQSPSATPTQGPAGGSTPSPRPKPKPTEPAEPKKPEKLDVGDDGAKVLSVQRRLSELGYWLGEPDGHFGELTSQAVYALQKAAGISRDGVVGPDTLEALKDGKRPKAHSGSGYVIEVDKKRQLLLVVDDGEVKQIFNTSTGSGQTYRSRGETKVASTPEGSFRVFRSVDGWDKSPLGRLYRPRYFNGGIAVHGYAAVPPYAASHGCVRVSLAAMDWFWRDDRLARGTRVVVR